MNIFEISKELTKLYQEVEDNDGELTPELLESLNVVQDNLNNKVESYVAIIKHIDSDIELIDKELVRLQDLKKSKNNLQTRLKEILIIAINKFGDMTKSGSRFIDYGTGKVSVRVSKKVEPSEAVDVLSDKVKTYIEMLAYNNQLDTISEISEQSFIDFCDTATHYTDLNVNHTEPITINNSDLENIKATVTLTMPLNELIAAHGYDVLKAVANSEKCYKIKTELDKIKTKADLAEGLVLNTGSIVESESLTIK